MGSRHDRPTLLDSIEHIGEGNGEESSIWNPQKLPQT